MNELSEDGITITETDIILDEHMQWLQEKIHSNFGRKIQIDKGVLQEDGTEIFILKENGQYANWFAKTPSNLAIFEEMEDIADGGWYRQREAQEDARIQYLVYGDA